MKSQFQENSFCTLLSECSDQSPNPDPVESINADKKCSKYPEIKIYLYVYYIYVLSLCILVHILHNWI